jgi:5'-3' exonuclease
VDVYLIDGTYELFRHFFAVPSAKDTNGQEVGAVRGVVNSVKGMIDRGATHVGVATDHVIESFRNDLYSGYKTGEGVPAELYSQFPILEHELSAMGVLVYQVIICTPDKDLSQCVSGTRIIQLDRRTNTFRNEAGVVEKFGVKPESIPDYLGLVGDSADGFPGVPGWGKKAAASVLSIYPHLEAIPKDWQEWPPSIRNRRLLGKALLSFWNDALLFRTLATLRTDVPVFTTIDELRWTGSPRN